MKGRNISFAEVLKGKARSPRLDTKPSSLTLLQLLEQWEVDPQQEYTLYLGSFKNSNRSKSSANMFTSRTPTNQNEEMFDSWIQRQSALNANKENLVSQPRKYQKYQSQKHSQQQQPPRFAFNSKGNSKGTGQSRAKTVITQVQHRQETQPQQNYQQPHLARMNMRHLQNIGGNIQMIKSNTCQKEQLRRMRSPRRETEQISLEVEEIDSYQGNEKQQTKNAQRKASYPIQQQRMSNKRNENLFVRRQKQEISRREQQETEIRQNDHEYQEIAFENNQRKKEEINAMIRQTSNIHNQIGDLAKKYALQDQLVQSKQSESQVDEQEDQLLIGNSDRKLLASENQDDQIFGEDYAQKARKEEQIQRQRREEAKMKLNDLMKEYYSKGKQPALNLQKERDSFPVEGIRVEEANSGVGYSFSSNAFNSESQIVQNQLKINNTQQVKSQMPSIAPQMQQSDDFNFRKKYVKEQTPESAAEPIQNIQSIQYDTYRSIHQSVRSQAKIPNQTFEAKFIKPDERSNYSKAYQNIQDTVKQSRERIQIGEPSRLPYSTSNNQSNITTQHGIKVSLNQKKNEIDSQLSLNSFNRDQEKVANQKIKVVSNQKLKVYSNSNKSSPAVSQSSQQRQQKLIGADVKTKPFVIGGDLQGANTNERSDPVKKESKQIQDRCPSPFKSIKEVKESIVSCVKSPSPETNKEDRLTTPQISSYQPNNSLITPSQNNTKDYPSYALPSDSNTYQQYSNNQYAYSSKPIFSTNFIQNNMQPYSNSELPSYANKNKYYNHSNPYQTKQTYKTETNTYGTFIKTEYSKTHTEISHDANPAIKTIEQQSTYSKYALPSYEPIKDTNTRRSYLAELELKQSINVEEPKKVDFRFGGNNQKVGSNSRQAKGILEGHLKQSLKQSIELRTSSEFNFDF